MTTGAATLSPARARARETWSAAGRLPCHPMAWPALWKHGVDVDLAWKLDLTRVHDGAPVVRTWTSAGDLMGLCGVSDAPPLGGLFACRAARETLQAHGKVCADVLLVEAPTAAEWLRAATRYREVPHRFSPPLVLGVPRWRRELRHRLPVRVIVRGTQRFLEKLTRDLEGHEVLEENACTR